MNGGGTERREDYDEDRATPFLEQLQIQ